MSPCLHSKISIFTKIWSKTKYTCRSEYFTIPSKLYTRIWLVWSSGSQPKGTQGQSQGVRRIQVLCDIDQYFLVKKTHMGYATSFYFNVWGYVSTKRLGTAALKNGLWKYFLRDLLCAVYVRRKKQRSEGIL